MAEKIYRLLKNYYFLVGFGFLIWMLFLDSNNLISRSRISAKLRSLEDAKTYYEQKTEEVKKDRQELMTNREMLEKFAREKYLMKRDSEDLFIIEHEP